MRLNKIIKIWKIIFCLLILFSLAKAEDENKDYAQLRRDMVINQIETRHITDSSVIKAMLKVPRHLFVPDSMKRLAYIDSPLPIGNDQTISQPYIIALMTSLLNLRGNEKVLEIGTGSGYQAAVLAEIVDSVFTIEIIDSLAAHAEKILKQLHYTNVIVKCGDGYLGWKEHIPFDAIIVTCAPSKIPPPLLEQLADNGKMVIPVGTLWQELLLITKINGKIKKEKIAPVRFVPMTGDSAKKSIKKSRQGEPAF